MSTSIYIGLKPFNFIRHHISTGLYRTLGAQRLCERKVVIQPRFETSTARHDYSVYAA